MRPRNMWVASILAAATLIASVLLQAYAGVALNLSLVVVLNKDDVRTWCR